MSTEVREIARNSQTARMVECVGPCPWPAQPSRGDAPRGPDCSAGELAAARVDVTDRQLASKRFLVEYRIGTADADLQVIRSSGLSGDTVAESRMHRL